MSTEDFDIENTDIDAYLAQQGQAPATSAPQAQAAPAPVSAPVSNPGQDIDIENTDIDSFLANQGGSTRQAPPMPPARPVSRMEPDSNDILQQSGFAPGTTLLERLEEGLSRVGKVAQAFNTGVEAFTSTLGKGASKAAYALLPEELSKHLPTSKQIQSKFDSRVRETKENMKENSGLGIANFAGSMAASSLFPGSIGAGVLGKAAAGSLMGGAMNQEGQEGLVNVPGAVLGGVLGAATGAIGKAIDGSTDYAKTMNAVNSRVKFEGHAFDATPNYQASVADRILAQTPLVGNKGDLATTNKAFRTYVTDLTNSISTKTVGQSEQVVASELSKHAAAAKNLYNDVWNALPKAYADAGINKMPATIKDRFSNLAATLNSLDDPAISGIAKKVQRLSSKADLSFKDAIAAKQSLWNDYTHIQKQINNSASGVSVAHKPAAEALLKSYWEVVDDIGNAARGTKAEGAFEAANGIAQSYNKVWNPATRNMLADAVDDARGTKALVAELVNPKTKLSKTEIDGFLEQLGPTARTELESIGLRKAAAVSGIPELIDNSMNVGNRSLNLPKFLEGIQARMGDSAAGKAIYKDSVESLNGLMVLGRNFLERTNGAPDALKGVGPGLKTAGLVTSMGGAGMIGANVLTNPAATLPTIGAGAGAALGGIALSTLAMSKYKAAGGLKRVLANVSTFLDKKAGIQPQMTQYILDRANAAMLRAGLVYRQMPDGSVMIDTKDDEKKKPNRPEKLPILGIMD